jgi:hypothetical protein
MTKVIKRNLDNWIQVEANSVKDAKKIFKEKFPVHIITKVDTIKRASGNWSGRYNIHTFNEICLYR